MRNRVTERSTLQQIGPEMRLRREEKRSRRLAVNLRPNHYRQLRLIASEQDRSLASTAALMIRRGIEEYMQEKERDR